MHDLGDIVYLDMHKTGSTVTSRFLNACCLGETQQFAKHRVLRAEEYRPDTFYFTTVRNPFDLYVSLYRYGCDRRGGVFHRLRAAGKAGLYARGPDGFGDWLETVLDPGNAALLDPRYKVVAPLGLGFMSFRHLLYALCAPMQALRVCGSLEAIRSVYREAAIVDLVIRNEELAEGLGVLAFERLPDSFDPEAVRAFLDAMPRVNASRSQAPLHWPETLRAEVARREALMVDLFYPQAE